MIRLIVVLVAAVYATMVIWGDPPAADVAVTRDSAGSPALASLGGTAIAVPAGPNSGGPRSDVSEAEAIRIALEAGDRRQAPAAEVMAAVDEPDPDRQLHLITGSRVNLRSGPSTSASIVGGVSRGDRAEVLSDPSASWVRIRTERGLEAWIYGRFLAESPA